MQNTWLESTKTWKTFPIKLIFKLSFLVFLLLFFLLLVVVLLHFGRIFYLFVIVVAYFIIYFYVSIALATDFCYVCEWNGKGMVSEVLCINQQQQKHNKNIKFNSFYCIMLSKHGFTVCIPLFIAILCLVNIAHC